MEDLDAIVLKCASFMFQYFMHEEGGFDYDVLSTFQDENGWDVILQPAIPATYTDRLMVFGKLHEAEAVTVSSYVQDRQFTTTL